jgi:hypothetical protein
MFDSFDDEFMNHKSKTNVKKNNHNFGLKKQKYNFSQEDEENNLNEITTNNFQKFFCRVDLNNENKNNSNLLFGLKNEKAGYFNNKENIVIIIF